jgi:hypothetical protein
MENILSGTTGPEMDMGSADTARASQGQRGMARILSTA